MPDNPHAGVSGMHGLRPGAGDDEPAWVGEVLHFWLETLSEDEKKMGPESLLDLR